MKKSIIEIEAEKLEERRRASDERLKAEGWKLDLFDPENWVRHGLAIQMVRARLDCSISRAEKIIADAMASGEIYVAEFNEGTASHPLKYLNKEGLEDWLDRHYPKPKEPAPLRR